MYIAIVALSGAATLRPLFLDCGMDMIQAFWVVNFFLFLLTLIFIWSKFYSISLRIKDILSILKKFDELPPEKH
jgi:predicted membrane channel-forming protein YqfA (hemolysin III family)